MIDVESLREAAGREPIGDPPPADPIGDPPPDEDEDEDEDEE